MLTISFLVVSTNADIIDDMVKKIKSNRESSIDKTQLTKITSPIPVIKIVDKNDSKLSKKDKNKVVVTEVKEDDFSLKAIMNNMAFINDRWVKKGEKIGKYTLADIMDDSVYLKSDKKSKMIFFKKYDSKIKITGR